MSLKSLLRHRLNAVLRPLGFELVRAGTSTPPPSRWTMEAGLARMAKLGIKPATLIDVGAAKAEWAAIAAPIFPGAALLLVEPLAERKPELLRFAGGVPNVHVETVVAAAGPGTVTLTVAADLDGSGVYGDASTNARQVPSESLDDLVEKHQLAGPFVLKLDTHGYELPIFEGARRTLAQTELIVVEVYGFRVSPSSVRYWELCAWLEARGFTPVDMAELMARPRDGLFWQADLFFVRTKHPALREHSYA